MKQTISVEIPDGFEVIEDQSERGYIGQSTLILKLKPISESAVREEKENVLRVNKMLDKQ